MLKDQLICHMPFCGTYLPKISIIPKIPKTFLVNLLDQEIQTKVFHLGQREVLQQSIYNNFIFLKSIKFYLWHKLAVLLVSCDWWKGNFFLASHIVHKILCASLCSLMSWFNTISIPSQIVNYWPLQICGSCSYSNKLQILGTYFSCYLHYIISSTSILK